MLFIKKTNFVPQQLFFINNSEPRPRKQQSLYLCCRWQLWRHLAIPSLVPSLSYRHHSPIHVSASVRWLCRIRVSASDVSCETMPGKRKFLTTWFHHDDCKQWIAPDKSASGLVQALLQNLWWGCHEWIALKSRTKCAKRIAAMNIVRVLKSYPTVSTQTGQSATTAWLQSPSLNEDCKTSELVTDAEIL